MWLSIAKIRNYTNNALVSTKMIADLCVSYYSSYVLFVVQDDERNVFDQRTLEFGLWKRYSHHSSITAHY